MTAEEQTVSHRIGVLGSAFNPPHLGHVVLAQEARWRLGLERVLLMPTGVAPHKEIAEDPGAEVRAEMARDAAGAGAGVEVSDLELRREGPSYAYRTAEELRERDPEAELVWLMGADAALGLASWERAERIVELAGLGIAERAGVEHATAERALSMLGVRMPAPQDAPPEGRAAPAETPEAPATAPDAPGPGAEPPGALGPGLAATIAMPQIGISSSMIRDRVRAGRPIAHLVPAGVAELIAERGLYGG